MATYAFRAVDVAGIPSRGEMEADTKGQVTEMLRQKGLIVLDVAEQRQALKLESFLDRFRHVSMRELAIVSRQFATLVASGMPMLRSLYTLEDQTEDEQIKEALGSVRADVEAGSSLADAMERRPDVFNNLFRSMVRSGESSGRLDEALERVAFHFEKLDALRRQVRSAMMYPSFVMVLAAVIMVAVVAFIVPVFVGVFEEIASEQPGASAELPFLTQITVGVSDFITGWWYVWIPGLVGSIVAFVQWKKTERGRRTWDRMKLRIPWHIGDVVQKIALARWSRTFSGTVSSGVPILQSIKITGRTSGNAMVEDAMDEVYSSVKSGGSIAAPIRKNALFPPMVSHMVAVGEETGQLEHMMSKIADFYEAEVDAKVKALTSLLEPVMIVFVGGIVGFIVISMYLPIFSLYDNIR
ncbi:MAG TPA: type II secretion system F family protein [Solirubrobacterales bacterium]|jgi:type IV pilus assembly protein PilC|nr:type II secretion system F family protein [Solirubrobacterales bacterium]